MTTHSNIISSPIVILEKLPINFEQSSFIKEEIIISDISDHSDNESRYTNNNNLKLKKLNPKFISKKRYKNPKICSTSDLYKLEKNKFLSKKNGYLDDIKLPIVVLERLSVKLEKNLLIKNETFPYMTKFTDNNKIDIITNHKIMINKCLSEERKIQESNKVEKHINKIKIKNEISEQIYDGTNSDYREELDSINDNILDKEYSINKIKIENRETDLLLNENVIPELIIIKKCPENDIFNENTSIEEYSTDQLEMKEKKDNLLCARNTYEQIFTEKNFVDETINSNYITDEIVCDNSIQNQNKSISLKEACEQMTFDENSDLFEFQDNFKRRSINFADIALLLDISNDHSDDDEVGEVINDSIIDQNKSLLNYISENENKFTIGLNQHSLGSVENQISYTCRGSKMKLFMEKCVKCNKIQKRIDHKISSRCFTCEANVYYECLICRSQYKYPAGIYNHISLKHTNQNSVTPVKCLRCNMEFKAERNMKEHLRYCKVLPYLKCEFCSLMAKRKNCLRKHIRMKHKNDIKAKDIEKLLEKIVENSKELKDQAIKLAETVYGGISSSRMEPFPIAKHIKLYCDRCKGTFKKRLGMDQRSCRICGGQLFMQCVKCNNIYKLRNSMSLHLRSKCVLTDNFTVRCNKCEYVTFTKSRLKRHIYRRHTYIHPEDYLSCCNCDKKFKLKEDLRNHRLKCERSQWCNCNFCDYKTNCREKFIMHVKYYHSMEMMLEEKRPSDVNLKIVADSITAYCSNCKLHTKVIEKLTKCQICKTPIVYRCKRCNMQKQKYVLLRIHVIRNHGEKIYQCLNGCGNSYAYLYDYRQHVRMCGKKPHLQCDRCPFKTKYKQTFLQHKQRNCIKTYTYLRKKKVLRYCYNCSKVFKNKAYMLRHVKLCGKTMSFLFCDHCSFRTFAKHILINHIQSKHAARLFRGINAFNCKNCTQFFKNFFVYSKHVEDCRRREKKT